MRKLKEWFYAWAFLDLKHTCDRKKTYFYRCSDEIGMRNLSMIRGLSITFFVISIFVIISAYTFFESPILRSFWLVILCIQVLAFGIASFLLKRKTTSSATLYNILSTFYLLHMLAFSGYIGVYFSVNESATVFAVVLAISQIPFILPPLLTTAITGLATLVTLIASYFVKSTEFFLSDIINCVGVFLLSILLSWLVNKIRAEEAFARSHVLELNHELQQMSVTDQLTNLPNHRSFQDTYYRLFDASKSTQTRIGIIMLDIDKFKPFNDNYGHIQGDSCLSAIGTAFQQYQSDTVTLYRFGGEEFIALLKNSACDNAMEIAQALRREVEALEIPHAFSPVGATVTISVGVFIGIPTSNDSPTSFIDKADKAMYQSKSTGGNRCFRF